MRIVIDEVETTEVGPDKIGAKVISAQSRWPVTRAVGLGVVALVMVLLFKAGVSLPVKADTPTPRVWLPVIMAPSRAPFDPAVDGFNFPNYLGPQYTELTSVEVRRMFGDKVCASAVKSDGTCTLTPPGEHWRLSMNDYMRQGHCEGMAVTALLMYNGILKPQDFGAARTADLTLENNSKLQREIAYWFITPIISQAATIKSSPKAVVAAIQADMKTRGYPFGTLRFSKKDTSGGHAVLPIGLTDLPNNKVAIKVYDPNYPQETRDMVIDTSANTWFYSPEATLTVDDYDGDASSQTLGFTPLANRLGVQTCPFCGVYSPTARQGSFVIPAIPTITTTNAKPYQANIRPEDSKSIFANIDSSYSYPFCMQITQQTKKALIRRIDFL